MKCVGCWMPYANWTFQSSRSYAIIWAEKGKIARDIVFSWAAEEIEVKSRFSKLSVKIYNNMLCLLEWRVVFRDKILYNRKFIQECSVIYSRYLDLVYYDCSREGARKTLDFYWKKLHSFSFAKMTSIAHS